MKKIVYTTILGLTLLSATGCNDFLEDHEPQSAVTGEDITKPEYVDNLVIAAYAIWASGDDINSSFSLWNYDVRSDDTYKGGSGTEDGGVFNALEICRGINTTDWNINDIWLRLYRCVTRANTALQSLDQTDEAVYPEKAQRIAEMRFLRGHAHFLLKQLFKKIVIANDENLAPDDYNSLSNTTYTNDEQWQQIADDFLFAYENLPETQTDKGRPTQGAAAAYLAKTYLYKAYRQDNEASNQVTDINKDDLEKVVQYTDPTIMTRGGYDLVADFSDNFMPEPQYENGAESVWAIQYSINDGTYAGNLNWGMGLTVPMVLDGGCDFHKPTQNLVNAFRTDINGHPLFDTFNDDDEIDGYQAGTDADPRLFHTVGLPGFPYKYNSKYMVAKTETWSRSKGTYGYNVSLKENVDPDCAYIGKDAYWASSMNHIVLRYADVMLMRAEALIQLNDGRISQAVELINRIRRRAGESTSRIADYPEKYDAVFNVQPYTDTNCSQAVALERLKWERRLELAMESDRFFDLVRWGEAKAVLDEYYKKEENDCSIYRGASFNADKNEYLPIPFEQMSASQGHYSQNVGW